MSCALTTNFETASKIIDAAYKRFGRPPSPAGYTLPKSSRTKTCRGISGERSVLREAAIAAHRGSTTGTSTNRKRKWSWT